MIKDDNKEKKVQEYLTCYKMMLYSSLRIMLHKYWTVTLNCANNIVDQENKGILILGRRLWNLTILGGFNCNGNKGFLLHYFILLQERNSIINQGLPVLQCIYI